MDDDTNKFPIFNSSPEIKTCLYFYKEREVYNIVLQECLTLWHFHAYRYIFMYFVLSPSFPLRVVSIFYFISLNQICFLCGTNRVFLLFFFIFSRRRKNIISSFFLCFLLFFFQYSVRPTTTTSVTKAVRLVDNNGNLTNANVKVMQ